MERFIEIICIGNELLIGKILNTNAQWLARYITSLGLSVKRIITIGDDIEEISKTLSESLQRKPIFIITTGGLGPTFDDKTLEGMANALSLKLKVDEEALRMVERRYRQYVEEGMLEEVELTPHRVKMATLPDGAKPLPNPVGTAPGVLLKHGDTTIVALPGVPDEMRAIFEGSVAPLLKEAAGGVIFYEVSLEALGIFESDLAPLIERTMRNNPYVYIKSHPKGGERISRIELHLFTTAKDSSIARNRIGRAIIQLSDLINERGGRLTPERLFS